MRVSIAGIGIASSWLLRGRRQQVLLLGKVDNRQAMLGDTESPNLVLKTSLRTLTLYVLRIGGLSLRRHSSAGWCAHTLDVGQSHWWLNYVDGMMVERTSSELNARRSSAKLSLAKQGWIIESREPILELNLLIVLRTSTKYTLLPCVNLYVIGSDLR